MFSQMVVQYLVNSLIGVKWSKGPYQVNGGPGINDTHPPQDVLREVPTENVEIEDSEGKKINLVQWRPVYSQLGHKV